MAETTGISWADATFNPWIGCTKVSPACDHCYAEALATTRLGVEWGPKAERRRTAASTWKHPLAWNRKAEREGVRRRVFCASLADVFDNHVPTEWRDDLWTLIRSTPNLDWLLLTKRPQNIAAIAKHIEALRGMDRWGVGTARQAFAGYEALPAPDPWWQILGLPGPNATRADIAIAYRKASNAAHPDKPGGSHDRMAAVNAARDEGLARFEK